MTDKLSHGSATELWGVSLLYSTLPNGEQLANLPGMDGGMSTGVLGYCVLALPAYIDRANPERDITNMEQVGGTTQAGVRSLAQAGTTGNPTERSHQQKPRTVAGIRESRNSSIKAKPLPTRSLLGPCVLRLAV